jgi:hypothetical protein
VVRNPKLLFIGPTLPKLTGYGTAMRAGIVAETYRAHAVVVPVVRLGSHTACDGIVQE